MEQILNTAVYIGEASLKEKLRRGLHRLNTYKDAKHLYERYRHCVHVLYKLWLVQKRHINGSCYILY